MSATRSTIAGLLLLAPALVSCSKSPPAPPRGHLSAGLIACWPAENADASAGHDATMTGGVSLIAGEHGQAFAFDGTGGRVAVSDARELSFGAGQSFSVLAWIQPQTAETSFGVMAIVDKRKVNGIMAAVGYELSLENGHLSCQLAPVARPPWRFSDFLTPARIRDAWRRRHDQAPLKFAGFKAPEPDLRDGRPHHVALTVEHRSRTGGKLYVGGEVVLVFDPTGQAGSLANSEPLLIGTHPDPGLNCGFKGRIADVRLYARALSGAEIEAVCHAPAQTSRSKP